MARNLARQWLEEHVRPEHRMTIYTPVAERKGLPKLLRSFRDKKLKIGSVSPIPDLGIQEEFDSVTVWSSDQDAILRLATWFETHGYETSGVW